MCFSTIDNFDLLLRFYPGSDILVLEENKFESNDDGSSSLYVGMKHRRSDP